MFSPLLDFGSVMMKIIGISYAVIICIMTGKAIMNFIRIKNRFNLILALGSVLFLISDIMLLMAYFSKIDFPFSNFCLALYYPGQCLIANGPAKSRKPPTFQKVGSRVPRLAFPPLNTVAVYSHLFDGGSKQTSISIACFQLPSNPDRPAKSRQLPTFPKVGICRAPRVLCFIEFQPSFNPDRPTKPSQPQTFQKVGIVSGDPPLSASSTSYASTCRFR